jgi:hypothetical protein
VSKTQESSRLKTRYLKGITAEQLFIISMHRDLTRFFLFKKKIKFLNTLSIYFIQTLRLIYNTKEIYLVLWLCIFSFFNYIYPITKGEMILTWIHGGCPSPKLDVDIVFQSNVLHFRSCLLDP